MLSEKVESLAESARYDVCLASCSTNAAGKPGRMKDPSNPLQKWIYPAAIPGQGEVHILKILQSNSCTNNCSYCHFASSNNSFKRTTLSAEELAASFIYLVRKRLVSGIFLSSGVCRNPSYSMQEMVKTAELLRKKYKFKGYIHLKVIPGCSKNLVLAAAELADRLSINMEAPNQKHLTQIAPDKNISNQIIPAIAEIAEILKSKPKDGSLTKIKAVSQTTQFVVGATNERDIEIIKSVDKLYRDYYMFRSYFSAYQKMNNGIEDKDIADPFRGYPLLREHRLYQCDFLMRSYGFRFPDLIFDANGNVPLETDPKTAWAMMNPNQFPVDINKAGFNDLIKVPGIGPISAERIIKQRKNFSFSSIEELKNTGAWTNRALGWIEINGKKATKGYDCNQAWLFDELAPENWKKPVDFGIKPISNTVYPAQEGKWVNYTFNNKRKKIWCR